jgi:protein ImuB
LNRLRAWGLTARAAIADTPGAAWAVARFSGARDHQRAGTVVAAGEQRSMLANLPPAALRLPDAVTEGLGRVGLRRIEALYDVARAPLVARFGRVAADRLDQALGHRAEVIEPRQPVVPDRVGMPFAEPVLDLQGLQSVCRRLLGRLAGHLERGQAGARRLRFTIYRVDGETRSVEIGAGRPRRDPDGLYRLFAERLQHLDPGLGVDAAALEATVVERAGWRDRELLAVTASVTGGDEAVGDLTDRLTNRLGARQITRLQPEQSHLPERAERTVPVTASSRTAWEVDAPAPAAPRPIRLLSHPERVEALAMLPDHSPARFRWRGVEYRALRAAGPERIAPEWWRREAATTTRDYFRIEDQEGRRYWLYREGLAERGEAPDWFLHGLFA